MKLAALAVGVAVGAVACGGDSDGDARKVADPTAATDTTTTAAPMTTSTPTTAKPAATAASVLEALKAAGVPIDDHVEYTAETDPNNQLGRPGGYTSKINFHDSRLERDDKFDSDSGGSIEVFASAEDAKRRFDYVDGITRGNAMLNEYHWVKDTVFLRVSDELTPAQAAEYEKVVNAL